jgi:hypothetical protein
VFNFSNKLSPLAVQQLDSLIALVCCNLLALFPSAITARVLAFSDYLRTYISYAADLIETTSFTDVLEKICSSFFTVKVTGK